MASPSFTTRFFLVLLSGSAVLLWLDWKSYWKENITTQGTLHVPANISSDFYDSNVVHQFFPGEFYLQARLVSSGNRFQPGDYSLNNINSRKELYRKIVTQKSDYMKFHIREGWCWKQLWAALDKAPRLQKDLKTHRQRAAFLEKAHAVSLEGIFAPQTYFYLPGMKQSELLWLAVKEQQKILSRLSTDSPFLPDHNAILSLAAVIEKEGNSLESFRMVSGVFHNRLAKNMRLQSDATVMYLVDTRVTKLSRQDLWIEGAHNTYRHNGLPPYAIAYPSKNAIIAAVDPQPSEYLYFLTDKSGKFMYSKEFKQHVGNKKHM